jgi:uncharacterized protein
MQNLATRYGEWALVTGASSGIGATFAKRLAASGMNLVLVARLLESLNELKKRLVEQHAVKASVLQLDLSREGCVPQLGAGCESRDVGLVVNNAGTGAPGPFATSDLRNEKDVIQLNCITPFEITHHFLPQMQARRRGGIILVSSLMGFQGVPYMANYSATKGYLLNLGEALYHECKGTGVDVLVLAPGATDTPGKDLHDVDYAKLPIGRSAPEAVVEAAIRNLGRKAFVIPGRRNHLIACLSGGLWTRGTVQRLMKRLAPAVLPSVGGSTPSPREDSHRP